MAKKVVGRAKIIPEGQAAAGRSREQKYRKELRKSLLYGTKCFIITPAV
jgi:hypothetical protein